MDQMKIGNFLKELRKEKGLTQEQLAEHFNVSNRTVSRWENGNNMPDISILIELSEFYEVDIREIIEGERKDENMNEEEKDTLTKVAEYTAAEKEKLLKQLLINTTITFFSIVATLVVVTLNMREITNMVMFFVWIGSILTGSSIFKLLQIKGTMNKHKVIFSLINFVLFVLVIVFLNDRVIAATSEKIAPLLVTLLLINSVIAVIQRKNEKKNHKK